MGQRPAAGRVPRHLHPDHPQQCTQLLCYRIPCHIIRQEHRHAPLRLRVPAIKHSPHVAHVSAISAACCAAKSAVCCAANSAARRVSGLASRIRARPAFASPLHAAAAQKLLRQLPLMRIQEIPGNDHIPVFRQPLQILQPRQKQPILLCQSVCLHGTSSILDFLMICTKQYLVSAGRALHWQNCRTNALKSTSSACFSAFWLSIRAICRIICSYSSLHTSFSAFRFFACTICRKKCSYSSLCTLFSAFQLSARTICRKHVIQPQKNPPEDRGVRIQFICSTASIPMSAQLTYT